MSNADKHPKPHSNEQSGLRRLLKTYVRLLHGYGDPDSVQARNVVNTYWTSKDDEAVHQALRHSGMNDDVATKPTEALLARIMQAHDHLTKQPEYSLQGENLRLSYHSMLMKIAQAAEPAIARQSPTMQHHLHSLHPLMRGSAVSAMEELSAKGIRFGVSESYRDPSQQNAHVRAGNSYAPNGYSLHSHGLALDLVPYDRNGKPLWSTNHPEWKTMISVMQKHGFRSLGAELNWDYPHFELPVQSRELLHYQQTSDGWRMIPLERIPAAMREHYSTELAEFKRAEKLITEVNAYIAPMPRDNTRVAPSIKRQL